MKTKGIIILEGPDGGGKTTLAKEFIKRGAHYLHLTYRWPKRMFEYHTAGMLHALKKSQEQLVVVDRLWPSEVVYATAFRGGSEWPMMGRLMDRVLTRFGAQYVFCIPGDKDLWWEKYLADKQAGKVEMYDADPRMKDVYRLYRELFETMRERYDTLTHDYLVANHKVETTADLALDHLELHHQQQLPEALDVSIHNYAGHLDLARWLVVGDVGNFKSRQKLWPFYEHGNCSLFLTKALEDAGFKERELVYVNINGELGRELVELSLKKRPWLRPIILGEEAAQTFERVGHSNRVHALRHPQFYRRFHHNDGLLVKELREIRSAFREIHSAH